jgi:hypothetical protein
MPVASHDELLEILKKRLEAVDPEKDREWHKNYGKNMAYLRGKAGKPLRVMEELTQIPLARVWRLEQGRSKWSEKDAQVYLAALK